MANIREYGGLVPVARATREMTRVHVETQVASAIIQARAEVEAARLDGIASITAKAMQDVALLSQMEQSLAQAVPHASGRLAIIADLASVSMAEVVASAARRCSR